jgi:hypothetical protein
LQLCKNTLFFKRKANFFIVHSTEYNAAWQDAHSPAQGEIFQINWQVKAFLHCIGFPHSGKEANQQKSPKTLKRTNTIWEVHESNGNTVVIPLFYVL